MQSGSDLADLGAEEFTVALETHLAAAEQISHSRDRLLGIGSARANGKN
jgi:hypothetical protein